MIHPCNDSIYLPFVTFSQLNAFSQNYLSFWPNKPLDAADFLRVLIVIVIVRVIVRVIGCENSIRED